MLPQLHDCVHEAEGLDGVAAVPFVDDFQNRSGVVLLAVRRDVWSRGRFDDFSHGREESSPNSGGQGLDREDSKPLELWADFSTVRTLTFDFSHKIFPERDCLLGVLKTSFDHDRPSLSDVTIPMSSEDHASLSPVGLSSDKVKDGIDGGLHGCRFLVFSQTTKALDLDSSDGDPVEFALVGHVVLILLDGRKGQVVVEGLVFDRIDSL